MVLMRLSRVPRWFLNVIIVVLIIFVLAVLLARHAIAEDAKPEKPVFIRAWNNGDWLRIYDEPCPVSSGWLKLRRAEWFYQGKRYRGCWTIAGDTVVIHDEQPGIHTEPAASFRQDVGI